ncbi:MAG: hypothetical protein FJW39_24145 [Acidobacteria bacterium]|nr:hypothetical protein [Acidobacteriota bacterium]
MELYLYIAAVFLATGCAGLTFRKLLAPPVEPEFDLARLGTFSAEVYRPLERLFDEGGDVAFLRGRSGWAPAMEKKLRSDRRRVFRSYLRQLRSDWAYLHMAARYLLAHSCGDRPDLAWALIRQGARFWVLMTWANLWVEASYYRLALPPFNVRRLLSVPDWLQGQAQDLIAMPAAG